MRFFRDLYLVISYGLFMLQIGFVSILLYNKYVYDRKLYYGGEKKIEEVSLAIRGRLAELLGVPADAVSVKAKTGEKVGHVGRGEAIGCHAVVLVGKQE